MNSASLRPVSLACSFLVIAGVLLLLASCQSSKESIEDPEAAIIEFLRSEYLQKDLELIPTEDRVFVYAPADLNGDQTNEYLVGLPSTWFCGSGGCNLLVLNDDFSLNSEITVADYPVSISQKAHKGWKDLITWSDRSHRVLSWNGDHYPSNASMGDSVSPTERENFQEIEVLQDAFNHSLPF